MCMFQKKPNLLYSAFFFLTLLTCHASKSAVVDCYSIDNQVVINRADVSIGSDTDDLGPKSGLIITGTVDLDIASDLPSFGLGVVTKETETEFVWEVDIRRESFFESVDFYVHAEYQFIDQVYGQGAGKICSSPTSCIDLVGITPINTNRDPTRVFFGLIVSRVVMSEGVRVQLDLSNIEDAGNYTGNLQVVLTVSNNPSGNNSSNLNCDNFF